MLWVGTQSDPWRFYFGTDVGRGYSSAASPLSEAAVLQNLGGGLGTYWLCSPPPAITTHQNEKRI
jgi:hypothetical protein